MYRISLSDIRTGFGEGLLEFNTEISSWKNALGKKMILRTNYTGKLEMKEEKILEGNNFTLVDAE